MKLCSLLWAGALMAALAWCKPSEEKVHGGIPLVIMNDCERCAEPFFVPTFQFKVLAGKWPERGPIQCKGVGPELHCGDGLILVTERVIFH